MAAFRSAFRTRAGFGFGLILFVAGCATAPVARVSTALPAPFSQLQKGTPVAEVRARFGAPAATRPFPANGVNAQIWSYPKGVVDQTTVVPVATRASSGVNPINGLPSQIPDQVYENRTVSTTETLDLLVIDDRVIEWKVSRSTRSSFQ